MPTSTSASVRVHILVPHHVKLQVPRVVVHRCRLIGPGDVTSSRPDGIRLTSPPRTLLDAASTIGRSGTESTLEQLIHQRRCTVATLMSLNRRLYHPHRPGAATFEAVLMSRPVWRQAARSELERLMREAIEARGLPAPEVNMGLTLDTGERIVIDLAWPEWKLALEVDHPFWHDGAVEAQREKRRDRKLARPGWLPTRVTKADIDHHMAEAVDEHSPSPNGPRLGQRLIGWLCDERRDPEQREGYCHGYERV